MKYHQDNNHILATDNSILSSVIHNILCRCKVRDLEHDIITLAEILQGVSTYTFNKERWVCYESSVPLSVSTAIWQGPL